MSLSPQQLQELLETSKRMRKPTLSVVPSPQPTAPPAQAFPQSMPESRPAPPAPEARAEAPAPAPAEVAAPAATGLEDFSSFSGMAKRQPSLPRGAKNVKCHTIERDPDSGKISKVYTYDYEEEPESGDQIPRQREE